MFDDPVSVRKRHFAANWLTWAALHHFLSAGLFYELTEVIVHEMSGGELRLGELFEEAVARGPDCMESLLMRPLDTDSALGRYLQGRIRAFAWQSDAPAPIPHDTHASPSRISPSVLETIVNLGTAGFDWPEQRLDQVQTGGQVSLTRYVEGLRLAINSINSSTVDEFLGPLTAIFTSIEPPLDAILAKHFGDLCADADCWDKSLALYRETLQRLRKSPISAWNQLVIELNAIVAQSQAMAERNLSGSDRAAALLLEPLSAATVNGATLLIANFPFDTLVTTVEAARNSLAMPPDRRASWLQPPLLHGTHNLSSALRSWLDGDLGDSRREFWAVLRRQIALGASTESRATRAYFARSILDEIGKTVDTSNVPDLFRLAIRLLLESGKDKSVTRINWSESLIEAYVDQALVAFIISYAAKHAGSRVERERVTIELFATWAEILSLNRISIAQEMIKYIAGHAQKSPSSFCESQNLGGRSLEVLRQIAIRRPELRNGITAEVAEAVTAKLRTAEFWTGQKEALETATSYGDVFSTLELRGIVDVVLSMLDAIDPTAGIFPTVGSALALLVSAPVKLLSQDPDVGKRILSAVLRFGFEQESERTRVLFYLRDFNADLLGEPSIVARLGDTIVEIRQRSQMVNTSNVVESIQALLVAPILSGTAGVMDALAGLGAVLRSAATPIPSPALPSAYAPLLLLADRRQHLAQDLLVSSDTLVSWLKPILTPLVDLWRAGAERPLIFAPFSFPPATRPNATIVHNWAFASIVFAESLQENALVEAALAVAASQPMLANAIALARATRSVAGYTHDLTADAIRTEDRETFYAALGRRLVALQTLDDDQSREICKALLDQCFRQGPRAIDASVFLCAVRSGLGRYVAEVDYSNYIKRLGNSRDLRLALQPIVELLRGSPDQRSNGTHRRRPPLNLCFRKNKESSSKDTLRSVDRFEWECRQLSERCKKWQISKDWRSKR